MRRFCHERRRDFRAAHFKLAAAQSQPAGTRLGFMPATLFLLGYRLFTRPNDYGDFWSIKHETLCLILAMSFFSSIERASRLPA